MKRQTWILAIGGVLILAFVSGGTGVFDSLKVDQSISEN